MVKKVFHIAFLLTLIACSEKVEWDYDNADARLVVEAFMTSRPSSNVIKLRSSVPVNHDSPSPPVHNAIITISDGDDLYKFFESNASGDYYPENEFIVKPDKKYRLSIELSTPLDKESIFISEAVAQEAMPLHDIEVISHDKQEASFLLAIRSSDPNTEVDNAYLFNIAIDNDSVDYSFLNSYVIEEQQIDDYNNIYFLLEEDLYQEPDFILVQSQGITPEYFEYTSRIVNDLYQSDPFGFSGSPATVPGNISNGALGYFYTSLTSSYTLRFE